MTSHPNSFLARRERQRPEFTDALRSLTLPARLAMSSPSSYRRRPLRNKIVACSHHGVDTEWVVSVSESFTVPIRRTRETGQSRENDARLLALFLLTALDGFFDLGR